MNSPNFLQSLGFSDCNLFTYPLEVLYTIENLEVLVMIQASNVSPNEDSLDATTCRKSHHPDSVKKDLTTRLNRIEGQIRGIKGMVDKDVYCDDIITQLSATQSALNSVAKVLLDGHLKGCVKERLAAGENEVLDELLTTVQKLMRK
jgi:CsoR family transcriptional regulator, copper-sensing transcriptional repressor